MGWIGIALTITKVGAKPILEPNSNRNRVIDLRCEWTINLPAGRELPSTADTQPSSPAVCTTWASRSSLVNYPERLNGRFLFPCETHKNCKKMREFAPLGATYAFNHGNEGSVSAGAPPPARSYNIAQGRVGERLSARHVNHEPRPLIYDPLITFDTKKLVQMAAPDGGRVSDTGWRNGTLMYTTFPSQGNVSNISSH